MRRLQASNARRLSAFLRADGENYHCASRCRGLDARMVSVSRAFSRRNLIAIAIGILAVGVPLLGFNFWLSRLVTQQGQEDVQASAARAIRLAEARVAESAVIIEELTARGVDSCKPNHI